MKKENVLQEKLTFLGFCSWITSFLYGAALEMNLLTRQALTIEEWLNIVKEWATFEFEDKEEKDEN